MEILTDTKIQAWLDVDSGNGCGIGHGNGYGFGDGEGFGSGFGSGFGDGEGFGSGFGDGSGIKEFEGHALYSVDNVPTAIISIRGNVAMGFILERNIHKKACYIVKENDRFAHGDTLRDAFVSLQEKLYDNSTEGERIETFKAKFPEYDSEYANEDLFAYHHVLTGSCRMGREAFCANHGIDMDGKTSVRDFVRLTKDGYGGEIIQKLPAVYGIVE